MHVAADGEATQGAVWQEDRQPRRANVTGCPRARGDSRHLPERGQRRSSQLKGHEALILPNFSRSHFLCMHLGHA